MELSYGCQYYNEQKNRNHSGHHMNVLNSHIYSTFFEKQTGIETHNYTSFYKYLSIYLVVQVHNASSTLT